MADLDRELQKKILLALQERYPSLAPSGLVGTLAPNAMQNLYYLWEHGLIEATWTRVISGDLHCGGARITAKGMDFLADDGGLSAILGVVTVKLHEDTIKALLIDEVEKTDAPAGVKAKLIAQIKAAPAEAVKTVVTEAAKAGLASSPALIPWLQTLLALG